MNFAGSNFVRRKLVAFTLPAVTFLVLLAVGRAVRNLDGTFSFQYWVYPTQTIICGALLLWFWREYEFGGVRRIILSAGIALLIFVVWISPQVLFRFGSRLEGFDPQLFSGNPVAYWVTVILRFLRLVVVVPLIEEIFWRGFLLRYFVREEFSAVPIGTFSWLSFAIVTLGFGFAHAQADWVAGLIAGALFNGVAYWTKSLASCVFCHALTNLLLGLWIMKTGQWGFW